MQHILVRDYETRSEVDLSEVGASRYTSHPSTRVLCASYCLDKGPVKIWHPGDPVPAEYKIAAKEGYRLVAHNAAFEIAVERRIMTPQHGFPEFKIDNNFCTMVAANAMALPAALEKCAIALNLMNEKDVAGRRVMLQVTKPRKPRKSEDASVIHWYDDPERLLRLDQYCRNDTESERELYNRLAALLPQEFELWLLDQRINARGFYIDRDLARAALKIVEEMYPALNAELTELTGGAVTAVTQVARFLNWLHTQRTDVEDLNKATIQLLLKSSTCSPQVRRVLELRLQGAQAAVKKVNAFLQRVESDGRVRGEFAFHSAGTGRWSSKGTQVHNLKRLTEDFDVERAIAVASKGSYTLMQKQYPSPLETIGSLMRPIICAAPGQILWGADFSGIESRVTAWLAGEESKLAVFRAYDAGTGPDPYMVTAATILRKDVKLVTKKERQDFGKPPELAFGFQGGVNAFRKFATHDFTDEEIEVFKTTWRAAHPHIVQLWRDLEEGARECIRTKNDQSVSHKLLISYHKEARCGLPVLTITLPSERDIVYPDARKYKPMDGDPTLRVYGVHFFDNSSGRWHRVKVYGGLLCENVVQGIARDLLAAAMMRLDRAGFSIVLHVHDEVVVEEPKNSKRFAEFTHLMNVTPDWAAGLPVVAKSWASQRYTK